MSEFASRLIAWHAFHGRHDLPWQHTQDPYRVWLSEIMLQQTQVDTVIPYYQRFLVCFPDVQSLAAAPSDDVLGLWAGLGYYARARNLHRAAQLVVQEHGGTFPESAQKLAALPGIGRSTAAAIASFCFGERSAILDGNVKRVLCRHFGIEGFPGERSVEQRLWALADTLLPEAGSAALRIYPQAQMDLGATVCTRGQPDCAACPVSVDCVACRDGRQQELPVARPRKAVPKRSVGVLLVTAPGAVLLEKRPATGIWGGLYSLPEMLEGETAEAAGVRRMGLLLEGFCEAPPLQHTFTHFTLTIQPWEKDLPMVPAGLGKEGLRWVRRDEIGKIGLPAPILRLLEK